MIKMDKKEYTPTLFLCQGKTLFPSEVIGRQQVITYMNYYFGILEVNVVIPANTLKGTGAGIQGSAVNIINMFHCRRNAIGITISLPLR